jgi:hypothetical protein
MYILKNRRKRKMSKVYIDKEAWRFMFTALKGISTEISFLCDAEQIKGGFLIKTPFIPQQMVSGAETVITPEGQIEARKYFQGKGTKEKALIHSHVDMAVFQSGGDYKTTKEIMETLREGGDIDPASFFLTIITNKKSEFHTILLLPYWNLQVKLDTEIYEGDTTGLQAQINAILEKQFVQEKKSYTREEADEGALWEKELQETKHRQPTAYDWIQKRAEEFYSGNICWIAGVKHVFDRKKNDWIPAGKEKA